MSRCTCCDTIIEQEYSYNYTPEQDLCAECTAIVRKAIVDDNIWKKDHILHTAQSGLTPARRSDY